MIAEALYNSSGWNGIRELKKLRLVSHVFAYLTRVQAKIFERITLEASRRGLQKLNDTPLKPFAAYVREVLLKPGHRSTLVGPILFREIVIATTIQQHASLNILLLELARNGGPGHSIE